MNNNWIKIPENLNIETLRQEFGGPAVDFYQNRIADRQSAGAIYYNPLKTIYIWATQDKKSHQGFYSTYRGYKSGRKHKNHGRS